MTHILIDMNLSPDWQAYLAAAGHEAVHWSKVGRPDASEVVLMDWARENDHVVLTADLDFSAILAASNLPKPSVIQIRGGVLAPQTFGARILSLLSMMAEDLANGVLVSIDANQSRARILPLFSEK